MLKVISAHHLLPPHSPPCRPSGAGAGFRAAVLPEGHAEDRGGALPLPRGHGHSPAKRQLFYHEEKQDKEWFPKTQASCFHQAA